MKHHRSISLVLAALVLLCTFASLQAKEPVTLKYRYTLGETLVYRVVMRGTTTTISGDITEKAHIETILDLTQKVKDVSTDGTVTLECSIKSGKSSINDEEFTPLNAGETFSVIMSSRGEILDTQGVVGGVNLDQMQIMFPEYPVNIGDSWRRKLKVTTGYPIDLLITYKVADIKSGNDLSVVKLRSIVQGIPQASPKPGVLLRKLRAEGSIMFDNRRGKITNNTVASALEMYVRDEVDGVTRETVTRMNMTMTVDLQ